MANVIFKFEVEQNGENLEAINNSEEFTAEQEEALEIMGDFQSQLERGHFVELKELYDALLQCYADIYEVSVKSLRGGYYSDDVEDRHGGEDFYELISWNLCTMEQVLNYGATLEAA